jgi:hypothetical protein
LILERQRAILPDTAENALKEEFFGARTGYFVEVGANDHVHVAVLASGTCVAPLGLLHGRLP